MSDLHDADDARLSTGDHRNSQQCHSVEVRQVYERVLAAASAHSRFVAVDTGRRVHLLEKGVGEPTLLLHGGRRQQDTFCRCWQQDTFCRC
jgi:hypothetical protein